MLVYLHSCLTGGIRLRFQRVRIPKNEPLEGIERSANRGAVRVKMDRQSLDCVARFERLSSDPMHNANEWGRTSGCGSALFPALHVSPEAIRMVCICGWRREPFSGWGPGYCEGTL